jgi:hypothetical protein
MLTMLLGGQIVISRSFNINRSLRQQSSDLSFIFPAQKGLPNSDAKRTCEGNRSARL